MKIFSVYNGNINFDIDNDLSSSLEIEKRHPLFLAVPHTDIQKILGRKNNKSNTHRPKNIVFYIAIINDWRVYSLRYYQYRRRAI